MKIFEKIKIDWKVAEVRASRKRVRVVLMYSWRFGEDKRTARARKVIKVRVKKALKKGISDIKKLKVPFEYGREK